MDKESISVVLKVHGYEPEVTIICIDKEYYYASSK